MVEIEKGYKLIIEKKINCPLCEISAIFADYEMQKKIWGREENIKKILIDINCKYSLHLDVKDIIKHRGHISIIPISLNALESEKLYNKSIFDFKAAVASTRVVSSVSDSVLIERNVAIIRDAVLGLSEAGEETSEVYITLNNLLIKWIGLKNQIEEEIKIEEINPLESKKWFKELKENELKILQTEQKLIIKKIDTLTTQKANKRLIKLEREIKAVQKI